MAILLRAGRGRAGEARGRARAVESVREVCLIAARAAREAAEGERLSLSGRVYRVKATQGLASASRPVSETDATGGYLHLTVEERSG